MKYLVLLLLIASILLTSCQSIYIDSGPSDSSGEQAVDVDLEGEYFTTGNSYRKGDHFTGFLYNGSWIFLEKQNHENFNLITKDKSRYYSINKTTRIVKYSANTGEISSPCLVPSCNHSPGSECLMMAYGEDMLILQGLVGDWMMFSRLHYDDKLGSINNSYMYNLLTGEVSNPFNDELAESVFTKWGARCVFDDALYCTKDILDYTDCGISETLDKPLSEYTPETKTVLCRYNFDKMSTEELFEVPTDYSIIAVTNKRYFFSSPTKEIYSCSRTNSELTKEDVLDFSPQDFCGTYAYNMLDNGVEVYDLKTNKITTVEYDFVTIHCIVTDVGIMAATYSTVNEVIAFDKNIPTYMKMYPDLSTPELVELVSAEAEKLRYSGTAQVWRTEFDGSKTELYFEKEHSNVKMCFAVDDIAYALIAYGDPENEYRLLPPVNEGRSYINIATGEVTAIPYLNLILPIGDLEI